MNCILEPPNPAGSGSLAPVRGLLELSHLTRDQPSLHEALDALARIVAQSLGFGTVVINIYRPEGDEYEVVSVWGSDRARELLLGQVTAGSTWEPLLDPAFRRHGVYFIPDGAIEHDSDITWYTPEAQAESVDGDTAWRVDDALFAPLDGLGGRRYGVISVDEPSSGLRPDDQQLEVLGALAAHAALAIESASQLGELEAALARNRAVIASTLDCVIAMDASGKVIEFNPAAERTFGYRAHDALGQDLAELLVVPEKRDLFRHRLARGLATGDWELLDRRTEAIALCADGSHMPIEMTVAQVRTGEDDGPVFYGFVRDITERLRGEEQLTYLAYHDGLTGLPNRLLVEEQLDLALARARRAGGAAALMFVDLDDFKEVNDRLGHAAGDQLLTAVASRLRSVLRDADILARQGGDEFLVLLADVTEEPSSAAERVGGKLLDALREPFVVTGREVRTGASIGISLFPDDAADTEALMRHADIAMYGAKNAGGGRLVFHERAPALSSRRLSMSTQLRRGIANDELELHWQPVWDLAPERRITGVEALLRWRHPERGLLAPELFLNLAEQGSAGDELIDWVLEAICRQVREWREIGLDPLVAVNASPSQLLAPRFASRLVSHITGHGLSLQQFIVELTESAWSVDSADALAVIDKLRTAGVLLALDDFGVGYSSLSRLSGLDVDVIKVDRRMLVDIPGDPIAVRILRAIFDLASACGATVVAEGVETEGQIGFLLSHGVTRAQGFQLTHPMLGAELTPLLAEHLAPGEWPLARRAEGARP